MGHWLIATCSRRSAKTVEAPILVTRAVAEGLRPGGGVVSTPVGAFQPAGMTFALEIHEITAPPDDPARAAAFSRALEAFRKGDWDGAGLDDIDAASARARFQSEVSKTGSFSVLSALGAGLRFHLEHAADVALAVTPPAQCRM